jgi:hypothetical protein
VKSNATTHCAVVYSQKIRIVKGLAMSATMRGAYGAWKRGDVGAIDDYVENVVIPALPHGSGIDAKWTHRTLKNGNVELYCSFHGMDENGFYDGWQDFKVKLFRHTQDKLNKLNGSSEGKVQVLHRAGQWDYSVHLTGYRQSRNTSWGYGLRDYLSELVDYALGEAKVIDKMGMEIIDA